jgi:uncharacterized protein YxeA
MCIKSRIFFVLLILISIKSSAQVDLDYFISQTRDTVFCTELRYSTNTRGELIFLSYIRLDDAPVIYKSKKTVPFVLTFYIKGKSIDRIPLTPNSKKQVRYTERSVDGKLKVYLVHQNNSNTKEATVMYMFYLKMPDNKYVKINSNKNMDKVIIPYLKQCSAFTDSYQGDYSNKEAVFMEMIVLYNEICL